MPSRNTVYNPYTLIPFKKVDREGYYNDIFKTNIFSFRFVCIFGMVFIIFFTIVDTVGSINIEQILYFRISMFLYFVFCFVLSFVRFFHSPLKMTAFSFVVALGFTGFIFLMDMNIETEKYFLTNTLVTVLFFLFTIYGIHLLPGLILGLIIFISYFFYYYDSGAISQNANLPYFFSILLAGISACFILERYKLNKYFQKKELLEKNRKINQLSDLKNKLFSVISHDFRGPLQTLNGLVGLVTKEHISTDEFKKYCRDIEDNLHSSSDLLENLLAWSKSQMGGFKLKPAEFNINSVISRNIELITIPARNKRISVTFSPDESISGAYADEDMIDLVLRNLLSNAVKFTLEEGSIYVSTENLANEVQITVTDTGIGMDEWQIRDLFEPNIGATLGSTREKGAGIGLILVNEFVMINGGSIQVKSEKDVGTTFTIKLPNAKKDESENQQFS